MRRRSGDGGRRGMPRRRLRSRLAVAVAAVCAAVLALPALVGCTATDGGGARFVTPPLVRYSAVLWPVPLQLVGAEPGARLRLTAHLVTARGSWTSAATYTVPAAGTLDLAHARPQLAPFTEPDSAGLFWSLRGPRISGTAAVRQWMLETSHVTITASDGDRVVASRRFELDGLAASQSVRTLYTRDLRPAIDPRLPRETHEDVPLGTFFSAATLEHPRTPIVLMFDDTTPGASADYVAPLMAQFGASVVRVPVTTATDGIRATGIISATTVQAVFDWLAQRPDIEQDRLFVYGTGAAEQLAVWAATRFPSRVYGLFLAGGTPALLCLPGTGVSPAFEDAAGVPCLSDSRTVVPSAIPPIDGVEGPVVLACGERDEVLPGACDWQRALASTRSPRAGDSVVYAVGAAHPVSVPPGLPLSLPASGGQPTEKARVAFWNAVGRALLKADLQ
ncbi:acyl-CoA thioesterase/BAAT N-terminal domain-containing protein [Leifsonia sp. SIMBA_070]|uniref:acyl-CoA thioesterase/bile acid-CoA:amino acid N-acyltransferase family protein n=1 Tax=Leifsonia sp. SIMBA_070 TaxID=3085810 RepID=UPI00397A15B5